MRRRSAAVVLAGVMCIAASIAAVGCDVEAPAQTPPPASATGTAGVRPVTIHLADATLAELAQALATALDRPLVIEPWAQSVASCARVSLLMPSPRPPGEIVGLVSGALASIEMTLTETEAGLVLARAADASPPPSCVPKPPVARGDEAGDPDIEKALDEGMRVVSDSERIITRAAADVLFGDRARLARLVRIVPMKEGATMIGMRLFGIRAKSAVARLGLRNGDVLTRVMDLPVGDPDSALAAYQKARSADVVKLVIRRRDEEITLAYRIVDALPE